MKITIEIDVQPDELRRFLGLPDIVGLQEDIISYMKEKAAAAADLSPTDFVRQNLDSFGVTSTLRKFVHGAKKATGLGDDDEDDAEEADAPPRRRRRNATVAPTPAPASASPAATPDAAPDGVQDEPLRSYDESSQTRGRATGEDRDDAGEPTEPGSGSSALEAAEEIGAALAAVPRRALRSLRARAPSFGFNLDAARERRARARASAHEDDPGETAEKSPAATDEPAPEAEAPVREARGGSPATREKTRAAPAADEAPPGPDEVF